MNLFSFLTLVGGLSLFLYGMNSMGDGLAKLSGGRMESILERLTSKRIMAVLLGLGVTAVIQSSSATTVMVVGFVNSGIMKLSQAVGIIMGANVGTTVTSWILSLTGIESSNFFVSLLKPSSFSPILAAVGVVFIMFSKNHKKKDIGTIFIGFAVLMFGMETMTGAVAPLADNEKFTSILTMFSNPLLGMLAGLLLTAVIQSSSASVGILQAICLTGAVSFGTAIPIIMGQNIGTCITAILSSIGTNKNAKRTAAVHLYFNMIGTVVFMIVFYAVNSFVHFEFLNTSASPAGIAIVHSAFNICTTVFLFPFAKWLEKLAVLTIRDKDDDKDVNLSDDFARLDERFLTTPGFAVEQCKLVANNMAQLAKDSFLMSIELLESYQKEKAEKVLIIEEQADKYENVLGSYMVKLSGENLLRKDSRTLSVLLHCIGDFENLSDHAVNILNAAKEMNEKHLSFSESATKEVRIFSDAVIDLINTTTEIFISEDISKARKVEQLDEIISCLNIEERQRHISRLRRGRCTIELGFILSDISTEYERVADLCTNIVSCLIGVNEDDYDMHDYFRMMRKEDNAESEKEYNVLFNKYRLPEKKESDKNIGIEAATVKV